ncbi:hypothetical protein BM1_04943 [Bipolaris maydis]|nr:hypothetical protein BM1_04943 [Bipolaris maydis]
MPFLVLYGNQIIAVFETQSRRYSNSKWYFGGLHIYENGNFGQKKIPNCEKTFWAFLVEEPVVVSRMAG